MVERTHWLVLLLLALAVAGAVAGPPIDSEVARLIKQLGDDDFDQREAAAKRLKEIAAALLDALNKAELSGDPEVRGRAEDIVATIANRLSSEPLTLKGHVGGSWGIAVSSDGERLLTSGEDRTLRLWDTETGRELCVFEGHAEPVGGAALSSDGKRVLSCSQDKTMRLWDAVSGRELSKWTVSAGAPNCVAFGPEGKALSGNVDGTLTIWDLKGDARPVVLSGHTGQVRGIAYCEKAKLAATCSWDRSIRLWNVTSGEEVRVLTGHTDAVPGISFSSDGARLLSASFDGSLRIWDVATGQELKRINSTALHGAAFSPDGKRVAGAGYADKTVRAWDAETGTELRRHKGHINSVIEVAFFPDGKRIASTSYDGTVRIWRAPR
jgi:WD40 repeat protein